jgi:hypothetical protein
MVCYVLKTADKDKSRREYVQAILASNDEEAWTISQNYVNRTGKEVTVYVSEMCMGKLVPAYA